MPATPFSVDDFRNLMRQYPAAVTVIATGEAPHRTGLTATAVMSLSMDPMSIVCAVNRSAYTCQKIIQNQSFTVNTLSQQHIELAKVFSGQTDLQGDARFAPEDWCVMRSGAPVLTDAVVSLDCTVMQVVDAGTHALIIGQVDAGQHSKASEALLYVDGGWAGVDKMPAIFSKV